MNIRLTDKFPEFSLAFEEWLGRLLPNVYKCAKNIRKIKKFSYMPTLSYLRGIETNK